MLPSTGGPGTNDPSRIRYPAISLKRLLDTAYDVRPPQKIIGPGWLDTEFFQIEATMSPSTTEQQFRTMLKNLLTDRFKLKIHRETKEVPSYSLVVAASGLKIKNSEVSIAQGASTPQPPKQQPQIGEDGFVIAPRRPGVFAQHKGNRGRLTFQERTMQDLAKNLEALLGFAVSDATGLTGKYDFVLTFSKDNMDMSFNGLIVGPSLSGDTPETTPIEVGALPDLFGAVQIQLGLKLEKKKGQGSADWIIVDHSEKSATEN